MVYYMFSHRYVNCNMFMLPVRLHTKYYIFYKVLLRKIRSQNTKLKSMLLCHVTTIYTGYPRTAIIRSKLVTPHTPLLKRVFANIKLNADVNKSKWIWFHYAYCSSFPSSSLIGNCCLLAR